MTAPERFPICEMSATHSMRSVNGHQVINTTHSGTVDSEVDATKLLDHTVDHLLNAVLVGNIHLDNEGLICSVLSVLSALLCGLLSALLVQIRKGDALDTSFGKRDSRFFADAGCCL